MLLATYICTGPTSMLNVRVAVFADGVAESVAFTVNVAPPDFVGVPVRWPAAVSWMPAGSAPLASDHCTAP